MSAVTLDQLVINIEDVDEHDAAHRRLRRGSVVDDEPKEF
jgi:hypothetical protein